MNTRIHTSELYNKILYNSHMELPTRKIKKSYLSCTGYFTSYKNMKQLAFESILERDVMMLLEFDNNVASYREQPYRFSYKIEGDTFRYTPDIEVRYKDDKRVLYEVKYQSEFDKKPELETKFKFLKEYLASKSHTLKLFYDTDIYLPRLKNLNFLYKYIFLPENETYTKKVTQIISSLTQDTQIKDVMDMLSDNINERLLMIPYLWSHLAINHHLLDLEQKLTNNSYIKRI